MKTVAITPRGPIRGRIRVPGSKSLSARALVTAALAAGRSELPGLLRCDDTRYLGEALTACGLTVTFGEDGSSCLVEGGGGAFPRPGGAFYLGNAGTAMRFLTGILTTAGGSFVLDGNERMRKRPLGALVGALRSLGASIEAVDGFPPVKIGAEPLRGGRVTIEGSQSSQFITALLLAGPSTREGLEVAVTGEVVSRPYLDLTCATMAAFGCPVEVVPDPLTFRVRPGTYRPGVYSIEPDASSASYFFAAAAITGGEVCVEGLGVSSMQGDLALLSVLETMGADVRREDNAITVRGAPLTGVSVDARDFPDMVPTLAAVALFADGVTEIRGVPHLRIKESDRIASVATELGKLGAPASRFTELEDGLRIVGAGEGAALEFHGARINPWGDHRIAMAAAVAGLRVPGVVIEDPDVVAKSFPDFFAALESIGNEE